MTENAEKVLNDLIYCQLSTYTTLYAPDEAVVPTGDFARFAGLTKYAARKALKELIAEGLVCKKSQGRPAVISCGEVPELVHEAMPPLNGYALTKAGYHSKQYNVAYANWCKSMEEWANGKPEGEG